MALIGQQPSPTADAARRNVASTIAASANALKNWAGLSFGNGLSWSFASIGSRSPLATNTRKTGASMIHGMSGMVATMPARMAMCVTMTMSHCCKSLLDGAESAQAQSSRNRSGAMGRGRKRRCERWPAIWASSSRPGSAGSIAMSSPKRSDSAAAIAFTPVSSDITLLRRWGEAIPPQRAEPYKMAAAPAARSVARQNHILQNRIDLVLPALAGKDAVVPDAGLHVVALEIGAQLAAQVVRRHRLADGADVVALALDGEQHGAADRGRVDLVAVPLQLAERQEVLLEDDTYGFQVEFGGEIEHGEIFVVERFGHRRLFQFAVGEILVELAVRLDVTLDVHAHEGGELDETRINAAERARIAQWHRSGQRALEPVDGALVGELVDRGRIDPCVDRSGHQGHAARLRLVAGLRHHGGGGEHGDAGLAHCQHVGAPPQ